MKKSLKKKITVNSTTQINTLERPKLIITGEFSEKVQAKGPRASLNKGWFLFRLSHSSIHPLHTLEKQPSQFYCTTI